MEPACPEGYAYTWAILAPGDPPALRGHRIAGIDNSDDNHVKNQIKANPQRGQHRAHRHYPNWKELTTTRGADWPIAGKGQQLPSPPASPAEFWELCMQCLYDTLDSLGLETPDEVQLIESHMTKEAFLAMKRTAKTEHESNSTLEVESKE